MSMEHREQVEVVHDGAYMHRQQVSEVAPSWKTELVRRIIQLIVFATVVIVVLIGIRFVLQLLGANEANTFGSFIFQLTNPLVAPFLSLFPNSEPGVGMTVEWSTLVAALVYLLAGGLLTALMRIVFGSRLGVRRVKSVERQYR